jgi:SAM-dependent methyltransferase
MISLAGRVDGAPERFVPEEMRGDLIEAEHLSRYWWAAQLAAGRRVLDAGCGTAYGSRILAEAGAPEVVGIDIVGEVIEAVKPGLPPSIHLVEGDVRELPFRNGEFDLVVCFEVIEHLDDPQRALDELARVTSEKGILAVSSPNRDVYLPGNPHHRHEFIPEELGAAVAARFLHVELYRQQNWTTSAVLDDEAHEAGDGGPLTRLVVRKVVEAERDSEIYTVALGSNAALPKPDGTNVLTAAPDLRHLVEEVHRQQLAREELERELQGQQHARAELEAEVEQRARPAEEELRLREQLAEFRELVVELHLQLSKRDDEIERVREDLARGREELHRHAGVLDERERAHQGEIANLHEQIRWMQARRIWRVGVRFWAIKAGVLRLVRKTT